MKKFVLRVIGTPATLTEELRREAQKALPFAIQFDVLDGVSCMRRGVLQPESYDVYDQWLYSLDVLWTAGSIQPIDTARISRWPQVRIAGMGLEVGADFKSDTSPADLMFIQENGTLGGRQADTRQIKIGMLPTTYNVDSFAYHSGFLARSERDEPPSWSWLLDERWHGNCTVGIDPAGSAVELALAARSAGLADIRSPGDLSTEEIDVLFDVLRSFKRRGHFTRFWDTAEDSIGIMTDPSTIGSLWSPAYYALRGRGIDLVYAAPKEGYRGWQGGMCLSALASEEACEAAYMYFNWWLNGIAGAIMTRQGNYVSVVEPLSESLSDAEWRYWYGGEPAQEDLHGLARQVVVYRGDRREGGSYFERVKRVAVWSTIMPEHNYLSRRWREFLAI